jgi:hypothetical protein
MNVNISPDMLLTSHLVSGLKAQYEYSWKKGISETNLLIGGAGGQDNKYGECVD